MSATPSPGASRTHVGDYVRFRGEVVQLQEVSATDVVVANVGRDTIQRVALGAFLAESWRCTRSGEVVTAEQQLVWEFATEAVREAVLAKARDLMWVVSGRWCNSQEDFASVTEATGVSTRVAELAELRGISPRTIWRDRRCWTDHGMEALVRRWTPQRRVSSIDPRWEAKVHEVVRRNIRKSRVSRRLTLETVERELTAEFGAGLVRIPSTSAAYSYLKRAYAGTGAFSGSTKGQRSIAERPEIALRQLRPTRPGEFVIMDTHVLDVFALDAVTRQWLQCQVTVAQDLYTRAIVGLSVTPVSTKAVDVATVLFEVCHPGAIRGAVEPRTTWRYHGVPEHIVFTEEADHWGMPLVAAENLIIDNGRAFISRHVLDVCHRLGISVLPAQPYKPTDKPTVERFFRTLREDLIMRLPGYKGPDVYSRGESPEKDAFFFTHELETLIRHWVTRTYHRRSHAGLIDPRWPQTERSPNRMYELAVAIHGLPRMAPNPHAFVEFLPVVWRKMMHYGFQIEKRRYRSEVLQMLGGRESPYGGPHAGRWPLRYNPDDITRIYIQHPSTFAWYELEWEHAHKFDVPLSKAAYRVLREFWDRAGEPADVTYEVMTDFFASTALTRKDRNAFLRSIHQVEQRQTGTARTLSFDDAIPKQSLVDDSDWDLSWADAGTDAPDSAADQSRDLWSASTPSADPATTEAPTPEDFGGEAAIDSADEDDDDIPSPLTVR